jgi:hypothetical protein
MKYFLIGLLISVVGTLVISGVVSCNRQYPRTVQYSQIGPLVIERTEDSMLKPYTFEIINTRTGKRMPVPTMWVQSYGSRFTYLRFNETDFDNILATE